MLNLNFNVLPELEPLCVTRTFMLKQNQKLCVQQELEPLCLT